MEKLEAQHNSEPQPSAPEAVPVFTIPRRTPAIETLLLTKLASSRREARQCLEAGFVYLGDAAKGEYLTLDSVLDLTEVTTLRRGAKTALVGGISQTAPLESEPNPVASPHADEVRRTISPHNPPGGPLSEESAKNLLGGWASTKAELEEYAAVQRLRRAARHILTTASLWHHPQFGRETLLEPISKLQQALAELDASSKADADGEVSK